MCEREKSVCVSVCVCVRACVHVDHAFVSVMN